jgi:hypothetical protein
LAGVSVPQPWPRRRPLFQLLMAIGAWLVALLAMARALTRADAGSLGWPSAVVWLALGAGWFWQWRRAQRRLDPSADEVANPPASEHASR